MARFAEIRRKPSKVRRMEYRRTNFPGGGYVDVLRKPKKGQINFTVGRYAGRFQATACFRGSAPLTKRGKGLTASRMRYPGCGYGTGKTPTRALRKALSSLSRGSR